MIEIKNLVKEYGKFRAVNNINLKINAGEIFGFLGLNGAGKTTTLRILAGILKPTSGSVIINEIDILNDPIPAKRQIGFIPDRPYLYIKLTAVEFLQFIGDLFDLDKDLRDENIEILLKEYGLYERRFELIESFSHGMKQRLATISALLHEPKVLIVDEPMVGLDPQGAKLLKAQLKRYRDSGMTILLSTHSLNVAEEIADRIAIINNGSVMVEGNIKDIKQQKGFADQNLENMFLALTQNDSLNIT